MQPDYVSGATWVRITTRIARSAVYHPNDDSPTSGTSRENLLYTCKQLVGSCCEITPPIRSLCMSIFRVPQLWGFGQICIVFVACIDKFPQLCGKLSLFFALTKRDTAGDVSPMLCRTPGGAAERGSTSTTRLAARVNGSDYPRLPSGGACRAAAGR